MSSDAVQYQYDFCKMCHNRHMFGVYTSPNTHHVSTGSSLYRMCMCLNAGQTQATTGEKESILTSFPAMACESSGDLGNPWLDRLPGVLAGVFLRLPMSAHLSMIVCFVCPIKFRAFHIPLSQFCFQLQDPFQILVCPFIRLFLCKKGICLYIYICII